ncbi:MAG TPA: hypothetical protein DEQ20_09570 [Desulfobulbaceae bacterium]|nr:MAG: hypothetical protein A2520_09265 [Deltaproteobacteria bacterium RIFOXYD12_FULL_53_23]HCC55150.1 hypothetical protein [Desulfobulbaceae bacterium]
MVKFLVTGMVVIGQLFLLSPVMAQTLQFDIAGFKVEGNTLLTEAQIQQTLAPFVGPGREMAEINKAVEALRLAYREAGYPVVQVFPPEQTSSANQIVLKVIEGKVKSVTVVGNTAYDSDNIRASLPPLKEGTSPQVNRLEAAIALANENSAKQVGVNFQAGTQPGDLDAKINVSEELVSKYFVTADNTGSRTTGYTRTGLGFQHANLFNLDHVLTMQYLTSPEYVDKIASYSVGYRIPFYDLGLALDLLGAYSDTEVVNTTTPAGQMNFTGQGVMLAARLNQALPTIGDIRHKLIYGIEYKDFSNDGTINGAAPGGTWGSVSAQPLSLAYAAQVARPTFQASGSAGFYANLPGGHSGSDSDYTAARNGSEPDWNLWRLNGSIGIPLPQDWQTRVTVSAQITEDLLIPGEQFGAGGATSVRGYNERVTSGDEGITTNFEIYTPELSQYLTLPGSQLRALAFWDVGVVAKNGTLLANEKRSQSLASFGVGLRFNYMKNLNAKFDFGWVQQDIVSSDSPPKPLGERNDVRAHFSLSYVFNPF